MFELGRNGYGILVYDAAVYADDPGRDDRLRAELFKKPPRDINATFGYRTTMSMKNQETWQLAHRVCGRYWFICGLILLPLSVLPMLFVINRGTETIGMTGVIIVFVQIVPMICVIIPTEHALRKNFDKNGNRITG